MNYQTVLFNPYNRRTSQTLVYNIPIIPNNELIAIYATNTCINNILLAFQNSLNEDGVLAVENIIATGSFTQYIDLVVESAMSETLYTLENSLYDNESDIEEDYDAVNINEIVTYMVDDVDDLQAKLTSFAFLVFTGVITSIISFVNMVARTGITLDTFTINKDQSNTAVVNVTCYISEATVSLQGGV